MPTFINDDRGRTTHVLLTLNEYNQLNSQERPVTQYQRASFSADGRYITWSASRTAPPLDLLRFVYALSLLDPIPPFLPIGKKQGKLAAFQGMAYNGIDAIFRRCLLPEGSPYINTVIATTEVVDLLIITGIFSISVRNVNGFYRPVNCLDINQPELIKFVDHHGIPSDPIPMHKFLSADYKDMYQ